MNYLLDGQESERLQFRKLMQSDFDVWRNLFNDDSTAELLGMAEYKTAEERCEKWFEWTFHRYKNGLGGQNVLVAKADGSFIGQCGLLVREIDGATELEIAYSILPEYRRMGFAVEAAKKCRDHAFENNFHERLISIIMPQNFASKKVAEKNGLKFLRQINYSNKNMDLHQIKKSEWLNF